MFLWGLIPRQVQSCASIGLNQLNEIKDQILTPNAPVSWNKSSLSLLFYAVKYYVIMKYWLEILSNEKWKGYHYSW